MRGQQTSLMAGPPWKNLHDCIQIRHIRMMLRVQGIFTRWVIGINFLSKSGVCFWMGKQTVEDVREDA